MSVFTDGAYPVVDVPAFEFTSKSDHNNVIVAPNTPWVPAYPAQTTYPYHSPLNTLFPRTP